MKPERTLSDRHRSSRCHDETHRQVYRIRHKWQENTGVGWSEQQIADGHADSQSCEVLGKFFLIRTGKSVTIQLYLAAVMNVLHEDEGHPGRICVWLNKALLTVAESGATDV